MTLHFKAVSPELQPSSSASVRAARGAAALDARVPGWVRHVDSGRLDVSDCEDCVLGQLWGSFGVGLRAITGAIELDARFAFARWHGVSPEGVTALERAADCWALTQAWRTEIARRATPLPAPQRVHAPDRRAIRESVERAEETATPPAAPLRSEVPDPSATGPIAPERVRAPALPTWPPEQEGRRAELARLEAQMQDERPAWTAHVIRRANELLAGVL